MGFETSLYGRTSRLPSAITGQEGCGTYNNNGSPDFLVPLNPKKPIFPFSHHLQSMATIGDHYICQFFHILALTC
ncbi:hypothetical protein ACN38_g626 [Penicillium nordicum]|uniref:Uncharacterized protein n=1 Tax=Penicillium nordicum TaxID=229535 RepID=A0A0M8PD06_9EURO|nr:hypothetical protein ACN38_g626 [Penicillium nordicum]